MRLQEHQWPVSQETQHFVLNVNPDAETLEADRALIEAEGARMIACMGPERASGCAKLRGERCSRVDRAKAILLQLDLDNDAHRLLLRDYVRDAKVPLLVVISIGEHQRWTRLLADVIRTHGAGKDVTVWNGPPNSSAIRFLLARIDKGPDGPTSGGRSALRRPASFDHSAVVRVRRPAAGQPGAQAMNGQECP